MSARALQEFKQECEGRGLAFTEPVMERIYMASALSVLPAEKYILPRIVAAIMVPTWYSPKSRSFNFKVCSITSSALPQFPDLKYSRASLHNTAVLD